MKRYELIKPPEEGWRGRMSVIAQILRSVFRPPEKLTPELEPYVEEIGHDLPPRRRAGSHAASEEER